MRDLYIDFETFSAIDLAKAGSYRYINDESFEALILAFAFNNDPVSYIDLTTDCLEDSNVVDYFFDESVIIHAHNATFERNVLKKLGFKIPIERFSCSMALAAYSGLPLSLDNAAAALNLNIQKDKAGKALIQLFCKPRKPTKLNSATRIYPEDELEKWQSFIDYCIQDVEAERELVLALKNYSLPKMEKKIYAVDQRINDIGFKVNKTVIKNAIKIDAVISDKVKIKLQALTGLENPNSSAQVCGWLTEQLGKPIKSIAKEQIAIIEKDKKCAELVKNYIELRKQSAKTSVKKYIKASYYADPIDSRARGLIQYYGAMRTGRFAGRGPQPHNLPRNNTKLLDLARECVIDGMPELLSMLFENPKDILSQLTRTMFEADTAKEFLVIDYSAIEARVLAWVANERWRLDVFATHGKIYEASASAMFKVPIESIGKGSDLRSKGKVAELALGYGGSIGALKKMGGEKLGMSELEMKSTVDLWRKANPGIVAFWSDVNNKAIFAVANPGTPVKDKSGKLTFYYDGKVLAIRLPSGRDLIYQNPHFTINKFGRNALSYWGVMEGAKGSSWVQIETYGGKITENIIQAIARDLLAEALVELYEAGFNIVMHIHDEIVLEEHIDNINELYEKAALIMCKNPKWSKGLPLSAEGFINKYYRKEG